MSSTKYIFVTGGVTSSLGKGIISSSLAKLLQARGYSVTIQKLDPYINVDPGTLNPYEHGECYVTVDGAETDLDLGHYERFLNKPTSQDNNVTTGMVYQTVINKERKGDYLGKTVQVIPHITDEIKFRIKKVAKKTKYDVVITEIGGTVGDIESLPYIESVRQLKWELGRSNSLVIHLTLVPYLSASGELKTKPTQHSVKVLLETGIQPDILVLRTERKLSDDIKNKVALFCNVDHDSVIESIDVSTIYEVPIFMHREKLDVTVLKKLDLVIEKEPGLRKWKTFLNKLNNPKHHIKIGLIGKYVELPDAYKSISESFIHAGASNDCHVEVDLIQSETLHIRNYKRKLSAFDGILVAPGFGHRGIEGKILAARFARENNIPFLGICLGMQCAVIEFARNKLGFEGANSTEMDPETKFPVIDLMEEQKKVTRKGGTMRLGAYNCVLDKSSLTYMAYKRKNISERHRHRYEFNNKYLKDFENAGMKGVGINPDSGLVEIMEISEHRWFVGVQFHPEYSSTVIKPHPLFVDFIKAAVKYHMEEEKGRRQKAKGKREE
ncbi:MAG: CTP synthase [Bacteroidetes bacterium]|nr:CTP synthase [Bacteroidota bacterium]